MWTETEPGHRTGRQVEGLGKGRKQTRTPESSGAKGICRPRSHGGSRDTTRRDETAEASSEWEVRGVSLAKKADRATHPLTSLVPLWSFVFRNNEQILADSHPGLKWVLRNEQGEKCRTSRTDLLHEPVEHLHTHARWAAWLLSDFFSSLSAIRPLTAELDQNNRTFLHPEITAIVPRTLHGLWSRPIPSSFSLPTHQISAGRHRHFNVGMGRVECGRSGCVCCLHLVCVYLCA